MATLENIQAKIAKLQAQAEALAQKEASGALEKIHGLMQKHGITTADIQSFISAKKRGRKSAKTATPKQGVAAAKYRDPKTGATWTGHGRAPAWIANVKDRTKLLVEAAPAKSARAGSAMVKPGNYVRGPQRPKYQDPKSGATWSGRGRAPAWLAGAKDPSKFLIDGADEATLTAKPTAARKSAASKNAAVKKAAASRKVPIQKPATKTPVQTSKKAPAKKASLKKAPAKRVARRATHSAVTEAAEIANVAVATEGAEAT
ncbi:H-NS histone family protein [Burkholderia sp. AU28942]|uniref:H-NS family nucleoid-associated regulatory protein n=1 Tax=Burkholderia TaxID=32008 RepID=UPI000841DF7A|nr:MULTISPECIES: H-NS family nucleoid-associated regulatory protein [Burkholderia]AOK06928.1 hypothetical protein WK25_20440 [Burkholderia latens]MCA8312407.1 H-NS histone family protein [Burkholderia sp. AU28942]